MSDASAAAIAQVERRLARALHPVHPDPGALRDLLTQGHGPEEVIALAARHGVDALTADALTRAGLVESLPAAAKDALRAAAFRAQAAHAELASAAGAALDALGEQGIDVLALKGLALGALYYPAPALRPMNDVDILVRGRDVASAVEALRARGFDVPDDEVRAFWDAAYYHLPVRAPGAARVLVELHWGVAQRDRHPIDVEPLLGRSRPCTVAGRPVRTLGRVDTLVHLALHHAYHYFEPRLTWVLDRALVARRLEAASDADETWARARAWGATIPLALGLAQVEKVFPGVLPPGLAALAGRPARARILAATARSGEPLALLRGWSRRPAQLAYGVLMIDSPARAAAALAGWFGRAARFGDRAGRRRGMSEGGGAAVLASDPGGDAAARKGPAPARRSDRP